MILGDFIDKYISTNTALQVPCKLLRDRDEAHVIGNDVLISCAVSDKLASDSLLRLRIIRFCDTLRWVHFSDQRSN